MKQSLIHAPLYLSLVLFAAFPTFQSSLIVIAALTFAAFHKFTETKSKSEIDHLKEEIKLIRNQIDGIQLQRSLGR